MKLLAHCKVNLCLEVLGRRKDGYHDLATVFQTVSAADGLTVEIGGTDIRLAVGGGDAPAGPDNLCRRAAEAYRALRGWPDGVRIELIKRVPTAAGLGGGSSDAATVLMGLNKLWHLKYTAEKLQKLAIKLGSSFPRMSRRCAYTLVPM